MNEPKLKRSLSLPLVTFYGLGTILGAGIYVLIGEVAAEAGIYAPLSFVLAAFIAGFSAYSYAQLSTQFPKSAGEVIYVQKGFNSNFLSSAVGFMVLSTGVVSAATICRGFVGYLQVFVDISPSFAILLILLVICSLAVLGIAESVGVATLVTLIEMGGLLFIIYICREDLTHVFSSGKAFQLPSESASYTGIIAGGFMAFYAYIGFEDMVNVAEEVIDVKKTLPIAIFLAFFISTIMYLLVAWATIGAMPIEDLVKSTAPLADVFQSKSGESPHVISLISMLAVINGALIQLIMASRVLYGMAREKKIPMWFGKINSKTNTPIRATLIMTVIVLCFSLWLPMNTLAKITSAITLGIFLLVNLSLVLLRYKEVGFNKSLIIPFIGALLCGWMLI